MDSDITSSRDMVALTSVLLLLLVPVVVLGQEETPREAGRSQMGTVTFFGARIEGDE